MSAMPVIVIVLCLMAIAYRYYSAFLAAKVAALDDSRPTPAERLNDGQNYHPTNRWVLFGHHFAAISGAGPLIGPVLAAQFGYLPGLLWIVIGVCLAGAVQDFLVLAMSIRRDGKSLAQIAFTEVGRLGGSAAMASILFIIVIALAGLGAVVVKALGGESVKYPANSTLVLPASASSNLIKTAEGQYVIPAGAWLDTNGGATRITFPESFLLKAAGDLKVTHRTVDVEPIQNDRDVVWMWTPPVSSKLPAAVPTLRIAPSLALPLGVQTQQIVLLPADAVRIVPGSSWGTFTIACTIPIALFVGLYMYKLRPGRVIEASVIGGALTLVATVAGGWIAQHQIGSAFNLTSSQVVWSMAIYGFIASVLPVWVLLTPRDYLSSFLKIGTIALLVIGTIIANPKLEAPALNHIFFKGGPTVAGNIFPFLFITIMCGAISGFHALVSSGTTPKMIRKESDARMIGYGAMLIEGLVGVVAMIAACTLSPGDYYAMNTELAKAPAYHDRFVQIGADVDHLNVYDALTQESLRGRTGGAVTLAVGMAHIFDKALGRMAGSFQAMWKYWYHFAIMFEALFILTTIDAGTRIGRFLVQELMGKIHPSLGRTNWWPGAIFATAVIVGGWTYFILNTGSFAVIWSMFGIANQMLAVIALAIVSVTLVNQGKLQYLWVTGGPMLVVALTTTTAALEMLSGQIDTIRTQLAKGGGWGDAVLINSGIRGALIVAMLFCAYTIVFAGIARCWPIIRGEKRQGFPVVTAES